MVGRRVGENAIPLQPPSEEIAQMTQRTTAGDKPQPIENRRALPRISKARDGVLPGIDLNHPSALEEAEDLARLRRTRRPE